MLGDDVPLIGDLDDGPALELVAFGDVVHGVQQRDVGDPELGGVAFARVSREIHHGEVGFRPGRAFAIEHLAVGTHAEHLHGFRHFGQARAPFWRGRNCWQVFRLLINDDGLTAFPTYEQLRPYLGMQPGKIASRETIAKALTVLRLTRWLSLGRRLRNDLNGQVQGNVYILHDEPVSPAEALELDSDYMQLLSQSTDHSNRAIREIGQITWREFRDDPDVGRRTELLASVPLAH